MTSCFGNQRAAGSSRSPGIESRISCFWYSDQHYPQYLGYLFPLKCQSSLYLALWGEDSWTAFASGLWNESQVHSEDLHSEPLRLIRRTVYRVTIQSNQAFASHRWIRLYFRTSCTLCVLLQWLSYQCTFWRQLRSSSSCSYSWRFESRSSWLENYLCHYCAPWVDRSATFERDLVRTILSLSTPCWVRVENGVSLTGQPCATQW